MARHGRILGLSLLAGATLWGSSVHAQEKPGEAENISDVSLRLTAVRRVCIESFGPDVLGTQVRETIIAKLFQSKRFALTENCDKADFVMKGSITERSQYQTRSESEGFQASASGSSRSGSSSSSGSSSGGAHESLSSSEVKQQAVVTLRIVDADGEIIWATSQESGDGKSKGAITLAAEQAVRRLMRDIETAEKRFKQDSPKR